MREIERGRNKKEKILERIEETQENKQSFEKHKHSPVMLMFEDSKIGRENVTYK